MNRSDAATIVAKLNAAYGERMPRGQVEVYVEQIERLANPQAAMFAVEGLIVMPGSFVPALGAILEEYRVVISRPEFRPKEIEEPELTEEQRRENVKRAQAMVARLTKKTGSP